MDIFLRVMDVVFSCWSRVRNRVAVYKAIGVAVIFLIQVFIMSVDWMKDNLFMQLLNI